MTTSLYLKSFVEIKIEIESRLYYIDINDDYCILVNFHRTHQVYYRGC